MQVTLDPCDVLLDDLVRNVSGFMQQVVERTLTATFEPPQHKAAGVSKDSRTSYSISFLSSISSFLKKATPPRGQFT